MRRAANRTGRGQLQWADERGVVVPPPGSDGEARGPGALLMATDGWRAFAANGGRGEFGAEIETRALLTTGTTGLTRAPDRVRGTVGGRGQVSRMVDVVSTLLPEQWLGLHRHAPIEIYYIVEGEGVVTLEGVEHLVSAGTAVYIPGDAEHGIRHSSPIPLRFSYAFAVDSFDDVTYRFSE